MLCDIGWNIIIKWVAMAGNWTWSPCPKIARILHRFSNFTWTGEWSMLNDLFIGMHFCGYFVTVCEILARISCWGWLLLMLSHLWLQHASFSCWVPNRPGSMQMTCKLVIFVSVQQLPNNSTGEQGVMAVSHVPGNIFCQYYPLHVNYLCIMLCYAMLWVIRHNILM